MSVPLELPYLLRVQSIRIFTEVQNETANVQLASAELYSKYITIVGYKFEYLLRIIFSKDFNVFSSSSSSINVSD